MAFLVLILQALRDLGLGHPPRSRAHELVDPRYERPLGRFVYSVTEPLLAPIRRVLPSTGALDLSPLILLLALGLILRIVLAA